MPHKLLKTKGISWLWTIITFRKNYWKINWYSFFGGVGGNKNFSKAGMFTNRIFTFLWDLLTGQWIPCLLDILGEIIDFVSIHVWFGPIMRILLVTFVRAEQVDKLKSWLKMKKTLGLGKSSFFFFFFL